MNMRYFAVIVGSVVPLTGHVDRNGFDIARQDEWWESCPSRGTWIEISVYAFCALSGL